jgi:hypothetical protein
MAITISVMPPFTYPAYHYVVRGSLLSVMIYKCFCALSIVKRHVSKVLRRQRRGPPAC